VREHQRIRPQRDEATIDREPSICKQGTWPSDGGGSKSQTGEDPAVMMTAILYESGLEKPGEHRRVDSGCRGREGLERSHRDRWHSVTRCRQRRPDWWSEYQRLHEPWLAGSREVVRDLRALTRYETENFMKELGTQTRVKEERSRAQHLPPRRAGGVMSHHKPPIPYEGVWPEWGTGGKSAPPLRSATPLQWVVFMWRRGLLPEWQGWGATPPDWARDRALCADSHAKVLVDEPRLQHDRYAWARPRYPEWWPDIWWSHGYGLEEGAAERYSKDRRASCIHNKGTQAHDTRNHGDQNHDARGYDRLMRRALSFVEFVYFEDSKDGSTFEVYRPPVVGSGQGGRGSHSERGIAQATSEPRSVRGLGTARGSEDIERRSWGDRPGRASDGDFYTERGAVYGGAPDRDWRSEPGLRRAHRERVIDGVDRISRASTRSLEREHVATWRRESGCVGKPLFVRENFFEADVWSGGALVRAAVTSTDGEWRLREGGPKDEAPRAVDEARNREKAPGRIPNGQERHGWGVWRPCAGLAWESVHTCSPKRAWARSVERAGSSTRHTARSEGVRGVGERFREADMTERRLP
jgi:hypothetical protein